MAYGAGGRSLHAQSGLAYVLFYSYMYLQKNMFSIIFHIFQRI